MSSKLTVTFTNEEYDDLIYACREAQIRFKRLRTAVRRGDDDVQHWDVDECNEKIEHFADLESKLVDRIPAF